MKIEGIGDPLDGSQQHVIDEMAIELSRVLMNQFECSQWHPWRLEKKEVHFVCETYAR